MGVGLSYIYTRSDVGLLVLTNLGILVGLVIVFTLSFLLHEIAHKLYAQHYGLWAEFRLTLWGALITLVSMIPFPFFKIISPGAVMIVGSVTEKQAGKTALAGPLTNIVISAICSAVLIVTQNTSYGAIPLFGTLINAFIALFNLIPFGIMDGLKVFRWNKLVWTAAFIASVILTVYAFASI
jgi:Zn-dependent protease